MIELFEDEGGQWRYRIKGRNGEPMATSEAYTTKADARRGYRDLVGVIGSNPDMRTVSA